MGLFGKLLSSINTHDLSAGVVGIDIGSSAIKVIELKENKGVITLSTYGEVQLGPYVGKAIGQSVLLNQKQEQEALVDVIRESAVRAKSAVFAMPLSSSFVTNVSIEAKADADLAAMVRVEARKVIPASLTEVTLDWAEIEAPQKDTAGAEISRRDVLIASIQNSALERFNVLMQFVGLGKPPTEIECFSNIRGMYSSEEENIAIVDIGAVSSKLYIVRKGLLMRMYRIRAGGAIATENIATSLGITFESAENLKITTNKDASNFSEIKKLHDQSYDRAFREFNQVIKEHEKSTGVATDSVYLAGGGALFPGMENQLKSTLNREVLRANPFSKVAYPAFMEDTMLEVGPSFAVALGAALRSFE